jgi:hypothetical protein
MPAIKRIRKITTKRKKRNFAISAAAPAIPVNPSNAAMTAMMKKIAAHLNIILFCPGKAQLAWRLALGF